MWVVDPDVVCPQFPYRLISLDDAIHNPYILASMNQKFFISVLLAIPLTCLADDNIPPSGNNAPANQLVFLRNGGVFEGQITKQDNSYLVKLSNGQVRIRAADVEMICPDLMEAYRRKKALAQGGNVQNHLQLADWCLRQGLKTQAAEELAAAEAVAPRHPGIQLLKRKLKTADSPETSRTGCQPVPRAATGVQPALAAPPSEELDRMIRGLPPKTVEQFAKSVQPLLLNNCTAGGCHGPQSTTKLRLLRLSQDQLASRRLTQRNLYMVLQYIDRENPAASPLLKIPAGPHGTTKAAIFNEHQADQYRKIVDWVMQFDPGAAAEASPPPFAKAPADKVVPAVHEEPAAESDAPVPPATPLKRQAKHSPKIKRGADLPQFSPKDEFDPDLFNRRYFPPEPKQAEKSPPSET
jgi:hypothetical protein